MDYRRLGRTGLKVSPLCLGTMNFGPDTNEADSWRIMDHALELGINFFDTADIYGWKLGEGVTERIIGRWFKQGGGRREKVVLATKVHNKMGDWPNEEKLSALHIKRACDESLKRLQTDHIDLYQMHHVDRDSPWEEVWQAMQQLVQAGKVLYIGSSNFAGWHIAKAQGEAKARNFMGLVCEQSKYSLLCRTPELEVLPACKDFGLGMIPWSPLGGGLLGGGIGKVKEGRRTQPWVKKEFEKKKKSLLGFEALAKKLGRTPGQLALAWLLDNPVVTAPIIGPRTLDQLEGSMPALKTRLTPLLRKQLDGLFPGPGGTAPEAYAW